VNIELIIVLSKIQLKPLGQCTPPSTAGDVMTL